MMMMACNQFNQQLTALLKKFNEKINQFYLLRDYYTLYSHLL